MNAASVIRIGAGLMALAVALGAFGAHGLKSKVGEDLLAIWETATRYHTWHALGLMLMGVMMQVQDASKAPVSVYLLLAGILIFSGSLYLLVLTDTRWLGAITPIGGLAFIAGWLLLAIRIIR